MLDVTHGAPRVRAWPRDRGRGGTPEQKAQRDWFRQASWAIKYMAPEMVKDVMEARQGKPLLPRDMLMMMLSGRLATFTTPSGKRLIPQVAQNDVSESLDFITVNPGYMLVRGPETWIGVPAPNGVTQSDWVELSFSTPAVTKWDGKPWFQADQQLQLSYGQRIEYEAMFDRVSGKYQGLAVSSDGQRAIVAPRQTDNNWVLYRYVTAGGASTVLNGGTFIDADAYAMNFKLSIGLPQQSPARSATILAENGLGIFKGAKTTYADVPLAGTMKPFWIASTDGLPSILQARYRILNP